MTEEEAKTKWCPFARFKFASTSDSPACNREGGPGIGPDNGGTNPWLLSGTRCLGSACMAWRWHGHVDRATGRLLQGLTDIEYSESDDHVAAVGYCGLAGKP